MTRAAKGHGATCDEGARFSAQPAEARRLAAGSAAPSGAGGLSGSAPVAEASAAGGGAAPTPGLPPAPESTPASGVGLAPSEN